MVANRIRMYSCLMEWNLHDHCNMHSRDYSRDRRHHESPPPRTGPWHRSPSLLSRRDMEPKHSRTPPLNVLVVQADAQPDIAPSLSALKSHWTLVCPVAAEVVEAARRFEPDVVFVDEQVPSLLNLPFQLAGSATGRNPVFVVLCRSGESARGLPPGYAHFLALPSTGVELEQLLWQIRRSASHSSPPPSPRPDTGMIG